MGRSRTEGIALGAIVDGTIKRWAIGRDGKFPAPFKDYLCGLGRD
jgi:hypothetical protein